MSTPASTSWATVEAARSAGAKRWQMPWLPVVVAIGALGLGGGPGWAAPPAFQAVVKDFVVGPEYDAQGRKKSILRGSEARGLTATMWEIKGLVIDTFGEDEKPAWTVESPTCLFDYNTKVASSTARLSARSADGLFAITGEGFEWRQPDSFLVISNNVSTLIRFRPAASNTPPARIRPDLEVTANRFQFSAKRSEAVYSGNVRVREAGPDIPGRLPMSLTCAELVATLRGGRGGLETILAEQNVVIAQGDNRASGSKAVYYASNSMVELTGDARWQTPQAEGQGDLLWLDRKTDQFEARGHTFTRLVAGKTQGGLVFPLDAPSVRGATNEPVEIFADHLTVEQPTPSQPLTRLVAEQAVHLRRGNNHAQGDQAVYQAQSNALTLQLSGHATWRTPQAEGAANTLTFRQPGNEFQATGQGWLKLRRAGAALPGATNPPAAPVFMEVLADQYQLRNQEATFTGSVQVRDPQWNLSCDRLDLRLGEGRKIKGFLARGQVRAEQKAAGGQVAGAPGWQLECEALEAFMAAPGEQLEKMVGRGKVHLRQLAEPSKEARAPQWLLTAEEVALEMAPGAARLQRVVADGQVQVQQRETLADGRWDRHWTLDCLHLELGLSPEGHQLREAEARGKVALEEAANWTPPRLPIKMRCEAATLRLGSGTNQMEYLEGREGVVIEQGLTRATAEKATVHGTNAQVELTGKPFLHLVNPKKAPAGVAPSAVLAEEPQALEISGAEVLTWDRVTNRFGGKGLYKIVRCLPPGKSEP